MSFSGKITRNQATGYREIQKSTQNIEWIDHLQPFYYPISEDKLNHEPNYLGLIIVHDFLEKAVGYCNIAVFSVSANMEKSHGFVLLSE